MIYEDHRYVYAGKILISTFRNNFPNDIPIASDLFSDLKIAEGKNPTLYKRNQRKVKISEIELGKGEVSILFEVEDPDIPDYYVKDALVGGITLHGRKKSQIPVVSVHMVISSDAKFDQEKLYPAAIENSPFLPRSYVIEFLNAALARHFTISKSKVDAKGKKVDADWQPKVKFGASIDETLDGVLNAGGYLKGVQWVDILTKDGAPAAGPYSTRTVKSVKVSVEGAPSGKSAIDIIKGIMPNVGKGAKSTSVIIVDGNGKPKVVAVDPLAQDVTKAFFIPQKKVCLPLGNYLPSYVVSIHKPFVAGMMKAIR